MALFEPPSPDLIINPKTYVGKHAHKISALSNPIYFSMHVLGIDQMACLNFLMCEDPSHFHCEWIRNFCQTDACATISSRGHIKTTKAQDISTWLMCRGKLPSWDRGYREIFIVSYSRDQIKEWMQNIGIMLDLAKTNLNLDFTYETRNKNEIQIRYSDGEIYRIYGQGITGNIRMRHPDVLIIDDLLNERMPITYAEAERIYRGSILGTIIPGTKLWHIGTILEHGDVMDKIANGELGGETFTKVQKYAAVDQKLLEDYLNNGGPEPPVLWPKRRPLSYLLKMRDIQGSVIFEVEYLLNPIPSEDTLVPPQFIDLAKDTSLILGRDSKGVVVGGFDLQISISANADYSVLMTIEEVDDEIWILDMKRFRGLDEDVQLDILEESHTQFSYQLVKIEGNGFQRMFAHQLSKRNTKVPFDIHITDGQNKRDKQYGIPSLRSYFTSKKIRIPWGDDRSRELMNIFIQELRGWRYDVGKRNFVSKARHDDTVMAFWFAVLALQDVNISGFRQIYTLPSL